ncbi:MAG: hypothetical protein JWP57_3706 [Spirosoma sp.]|nr:hypothetical protein [Spirosoma sp.]
MSDQAPLTLTPRQRLVELEMADKRRRYPTVPESYLVKPKFPLKDTNSLTKAVLRCLELHGCYVTRIQSQGQFNDQTGHWQRGTTRKGTADLHAVINGRHVSIEIKWGKDRLSADQKKTAESVKAAGGVYLVVSNYDTFWCWFEQFAPDLVHQKRGGEQR